MKSLASDHGGPIVFHFGRSTRLTKGPAVFVDRDGVINLRPREYVRRWSEFRFTHGIGQVFRYLGECGFPILIVSNQAGIGFGLISLQNLKDITTQFVRHLAQAGCQVQGVYYCPHTPQQACRCRKPKVEMLKLASLDWSIDLRRSVFIGDTTSDMQAARLCGCYPVLFSPTRDSLVQCKALPEPFPTIAWNPAQLLALLRRSIQRRASLE